MPNKQSVKQAIYELLVTPNSQHVTVCRIWGSRSGDYEVYNPAFYFFTAGSILDLLFDTEDGSEMFLRNVGWLKWTTCSFTPEDMTLDTRI
jgi:hypothetical protein